MSYKIENGSLRVSNYYGADMFDTVIIENLNIVKFTYTNDEKNLYFLFKDYNNNNNNKLEFKEDNINNEKIIQESRTFLKSTNIQVLTNFFPTKVWLYDSEGIYMLEDIQNDIIVSYDLVKSKPVGFVKGFKN